ncbi:MAG: nuclear transport factor 2 family protein [Acidobacteriota bacterium]|nr:nuclear transport factor 2 family protein [Acidobacteriota bacterium]
MKRLLSPTIFILVAAFGLHGQTAPDSVALTTLLNEFLAGASRNDAAMHDRFWAEDLIYTRSSGKRIGKADIMRDVRSAPAPKPEDPTTTYTAKDIRIQQYDNTAIVAFRLIGTTSNNGRIEVTSYLNTGTFLKRNGKWQAVSWQATKTPRQEDEARREVAAAESAFHQAMLASDVKKLDSMVDETFTWTHPTGEQMTRQQLLDRLASGQLKYSRLETNNVAVSVYGDTGVVRGVSREQRSSTPGAGSGDASPVTASFTLTFVNKDGTWKAVAMHSSRP